MLNAPFLREMMRLHFDAIKAHKRVFIWRHALGNLGHLVGNLNEHIVSKDDGSTSVFWHSPFKLQAILDLPASPQTLGYVGFALKTLNSAPPTITLGAKQG